MVSVISLLNQQICELRENCNLLDETHHNYEISRF